MLLLVLLCIAVSGIDACSTDADCLANEECQGGNCACAPGYENITNVCTKVLGKNCSSWFNCLGVSFSECNFGVCVCDSDTNYYEHNNVCKSVIGRTCTDEVECLSERYVSCRGGACECDHGYNRSGDNCIRTTCSTDDDCTDPNTSCSGFYCYCSDGYSLENGACTSDLGRECGMSSGLSFWCSYPTTSCVNSRCECSTLFREENGACVSYLNDSCQVDSDCGTDNRIHCYNGTCECLGSYIQDGDNCRPIIYSSCYNDTSCPLEYSNCSNYYSWQYNGRCRCIDGAFLDYNDYYCKPELGASCSISYYSLCSTPPRYCDANNTCTCGFGTVESDDLLSCESVFNRSCSSTSDCEDENMFTCNSGLCKCSETFVERGYDPFWNYDIPCVKRIGLSCNDTECTFDNAECNNDNECACIPGYIEDEGNCIQGFGAQCHHNAVCNKFDDNTICDNNTCKCKYGFSEVSGECIAVLGSGCSTNSDCDSISFASCTDDLVCRCQAGYDEYKNQCVVESLAAENVPLLPNLQRRLQAYTLDFPNEFAIDDNGQEEKWYSLGDFFLLMDPAVPSKGDCGTVHPIYVDEMTQEEIDALDDTGTTVRATVAGLEEYGIAESFDINIRRLGKDVQLYLKRPSTAMAAYCLGGQDLLISRPREIPTVKSELRFSSTPVNNVTNFDPFLLFKCDLQPSYMWYGFRYSQYYGKYFIVNWYVNNNHLVTYGPVEWSHLNDTNLNESILLHHNYLIGFKIQCSYQQMDKLTGYVSMPKFSPSVNTNVKTRLKYSYFGFSSPTSGYITPQLTAPLGCSSIDSDDANLCKYDFGIDSSNGSCPISSNDHEMCGFVINATTYHGSFEQLSGYDWNIVFNGRYSFDIFEDDQGQRVKEYIRSNLILPAGLSQHDYYRPFRFRTQNKPLSTGHSIWEGYRTSDLKIYPYSSYGSGQRVQFYSGYAIYWNSRSVHNVHVQAGEYILYRSNLLPIEIQVKLQVRGTGTTEVCGLSIRNMNAIRIESYCDQTNFTASTGGEVSWDEENTWGKSMYFDNGLLFGVSTYSGSFSGFTFEGFDSVFKNGEGVATIPEGYNKRDGTITTSVTDYVNSWKISFDESLRNPENHGTYSYTTEYYLCECPDSATNMSDRYQYNSLETVIQYNGVIHCTLDYLCEEQVDGNNVWPSTLMPNYAIEDIDIFVEVRYNGSLPRMIFRCNFTTTTGYYYRVLWKVDRQVVLETEILPESNFQEYGLTDEQLLDVAENMYLNSEIVCGVSVYSGQNMTNSLLGYKNSSEYIPFKMDSDRFYLPRAGRILFRLRRNIPLACNAESTCYANLKVFDPDDTYNCLNSSIAVVNQDMCGQILTGTTSSLTGFEAVDVDLTLTTVYAGTYNLRTYYNLTFAIETVGVTTALWSRPFNKTVSGYVTDNNYLWQSRRCYVNNDPRVGTFDRIYLLHDRVGEFILVAHRTMNMQIQIQTFYCGGWRAVCSCGVAFQAGKEVYAVNHCNGTHFSGFLSRDTRPLITIRRKGLNRFRIYLPSGTYAEVRVSPWNQYLVNIDIIPTLTDVGAVRGICGNYNGDWTDDFELRDGTIETTNRWWYYYGADDFLESWRVDEAESLLNPLINETLDSWDETGDVKCVCPQESGTNRLVCGISEDAICLDTTNVQDTSINNSFRRKRSVARQEELFRKLNSVNYQPEMERIVKRSTDVNYTIEEAREICNNSLTSNCGQFNLGSALNETGLNVTRFVEDCALDLQLNPDTDWADETCGVITVVADVELSMNQTFQEHNSEVFQAFTALKCPGKSNCSGNGVCSKGVCICLDGYGSEDCFLLLSAPPYIEAVVGNGTCDTSSEDNCHCITLTTNGTSDTATCNITVSDVGQNGTAENDTTYNVNVTSLNFNEVECCVPNNARRRRSTGSSSIAQVYNVALSNDGQNFGTTVQMYVLDTTCQQTSNDSQGNKIVLLKSGYCYIDGTCVQNNTKSSNDSCYYCLPEKDAFDWTEVGCPNVTTVASTTNNNNNNSGDDDGGSVTLIIVLVTVFSCVLCVGVGVLIYFAYKHSKKLNRLGSQPSMPQPIMPPPLYFDVTPNNRFHGNKGSRKFAYE